MGPFLVFAIFNFETIAVHIRFRHSEIDSCFTLLQINRFIFMKLFCWQLCRCRWCFRRLLIIKHFHHLLAERCHDDMKWRRFRRRLIRLRQVFIASFAMANQLIASFEDLCAIQAFKWSFGSVLKKLLELKEVQYCKTRSLLACEFSYVAWVRPNLRNAYRKRGSYTCLAFARSALDEHAWQASTSS